MRAIVHDRHGPPQAVLRCEDRADPVPDRGRVCVALECAAVHPADLLAVAGHYASMPRMPGAVPGLEGVGRVVAAGPDTTTAVGSRVLLPLGSGTWRDRLVLPEHHLIPAPDDLDATQLALAVVNPLTAALLLTSVVDLRPGEWVVQNAATSSVGRLVAATANDRGIRTVNVVRAGDEARAVHAAGGDVVVVDDGRLAEQVAAYTGRAQIRLALDAVGGAATDRLASTVAHGGTVLTFGALSGRPCELSAAHAVFRDVRLRGFWLTTWWQRADETTRRATVAAHLAHLRAPRRQLHIAAAYPLDRFHDAIEHAMSGGRGGKIVLTGEAYPSH